MHENELYHHGILGMHWGDKNGPPYPLKSKDHSASEKKAERRKSLDNNSDARIIKKGTKVYRVSNNKNDVTFDNKKYVSLNKEDNDIWATKFGRYYGGLGQETYNIKYTTIKDLKIAPYTKLGELWVNQQLDIENSQVINDTQASAKVHGLYRSDGKYEDINKILSGNFNQQTKTGKEFVDKLLKLGYDGIEDRNGQNIAKDPIIIFDPNKNIKKISTSRNEWDKEFWDLINKKIRQKDQTFKKETILDEYNKWYSDPEEYMRMNKK